MQISIALCTYNGETYLKEQLASLVRQTRLPDELVVCDDRSRDATLEILEEFAGSAPFPVRIFPNATNLGPMQNFARAVGLCQGEWIALCDQDDVWLPDKLAVATTRLAELEAAHGAQTPLLVHTDAVVAGSDLRTLGPSLWRFQHSYPEKGHPLARLLSQNLVTGCTAVLNRALRDRALPLPGRVVMHDWWFALVAAAFGQVACVPQATLLYRQHGRNDTGAKSWGLLTALRSLLDVKNSNHLLRTKKEVSRRIRNQAADFVERYGKELTQRQRETLAAFIDLPNRSYLARKYLILKYGLHYQGLLRNIGNLVLK